MWRIRLFEDDVFVGLPYHKSQIDRHKVISRLPKDYGTNKNLEEETVEASLDECRTKEYMPIATSYFSDENILIFYKI